MILRDGRPKASLSALIRHEAQRRPLPLRAAPQKTDDQVKRKGTKPEIRCSASPAFWKSGRPVEQLLCARFQIEARVLVGLVACEGGDALHEIEDALGLAPFLSQHGLDDLRGLSLGEAALAQELAAVVIGAGDNLFPRRLDAVDEWEG